jgi:hypothetical protein
MARLDLGFGLVVLDDRLVKSALAPVGVGTRDSSYTEAEPAPGDATSSDAGSRWLPRVSGAQSAELELYTIRGGYPGRSGAEVLVRLASETDVNNWRSWQDPNLVTGFTGGASAGATAAWNTVVAWDTVAACATRTAIVIVAVDDSVAEGRTWRYDPRTGVWTDGMQFPAGFPGLEGPIGLVYDSEADRAILYSGTNAASGLRQAAFYSTDEGVTWLRYGRRVLLGTASGNNLGALRVAARPRALDWLMFSIDETDGTGESSQWASSDSGTTWELVGSVDSASLACYPVWTGSHFLVAYVDSSTKEPRVKLLASARADFDAAAYVVVDSVRDAEIVVPVVDADGTVYLYATENDGGTPRYNVAVYRSTDGGASWSRYLTDLITDESTSALEPHVGVAFGGCVYLIGVGDVSGSVSDGVIGVIRCGGWSSVAHGGGAVGTLHEHERRPGFGGPAFLTTTEGLVYWPVGGPVTYRGWTSFATAGAPVVSIAKTGFDAIHFEGTAALDRVEYAVTATDPGHLSAMLELEGWVDAAPDRATITGLIAHGFVSGALVRLSDALTYEYDVIVHLASDGVVIEDGNDGTVIASVALTMDGTDASDRLVWTRIRVYLTAARVNWWYAQGTGDYSDTWTKGTGGTVSNGVAATQSRLIWGLNNVPATPVIFAIRWIGVSFGGEWQQGIDALSAWDEGYTNGLRGHQFGKPLSGRGGAYPLPVATSDTEPLGYLSASGGPTRYGEEVDLAVDHGAPVRAVHALESPSPRDRWRATGTAEVDLVYDLSIVRWYGDALALVAIGARPHEWILETDDGSSGWTVHGTLDLTLGSSLTYARTGDAVYAAGGTSGTRHYAEGELVGGYVVSGGVAAEILGNSGGFWGSASSTRQPLRLRIEPTPEFPASGTDLRVVSPRGLLVVYPSTLLARRYVRLRATALQVVPGSVYGAGILSVGRVLAIGGDPAWAWQRATVASVRRSRTSDGVSHARQLGPPARRLSYSWPEYADLRKLRDGLDFHGASGGLAIGSAEDSARVPDLLEPLRSGEVPVVVVPRLPSSTGALLGRDDWLYGRVVSDSITATGKLGTEGVDEVVTISELVVEELR